MKTFVVQNVSILSATKFGCGLGALSNFVPGLVTALIAKSIVASLRILLESWQNAELANVLGQSIRANMLTILKLEGALKTLQDLDNAAPVFFIGTIIAWMLLGGAFVAAMSGMVTAIYNLTARLFGGIEIELRENTASVAPTSVVPPCVETRS